MCSRDTPYVTLQDCRLVKRGEHPRQALIRPDHNYESCMSPPSPPLSGGSSRGQAIPACFGRTPQYYLKKYNNARMWVWRLLLQDPKKRGGGGGKENTVWESVDAGGERVPVGEGGMHKIDRWFKGMEVWRFDRVE